MMRVGLLFNAHVTWIMYMRCVFNLLDRSLSLPLFLSVCRCVYIKMDLYQNQKERKHHVCVYELSLLATVCRVNITSSSLFFRLLLYNNARQKAEKNTQTHTPTFTNSKLKEITENISLLSIDRKLFEFQFEWNTHPKGLNYLDQMSCRKKNFDLKTMLLCRYALNFVFSGYIWLEHAIEIHNSCFDSRNKQIGSEVVVSKGIAVDRFDLLWKFLTFSDF